MPMDPKLAQIYGNTPDADLEKLAAAELADSLSDEGDANLNDMSEEQLEALASQVLSGDDTQEEEVAQNDPDQDAQEKVAEADYMGRVMAHAYVQELRSLTKVAEETPAEEKKEEAAAPAAEATKGKMQKVKEHLSGNKKKYLGAAAAVGAGAAAAKYGPRAGLFGKGVKAMAGGSARGFKKNSSAMDTLVEARMMEILEQSGIDPASLTTQEAPQAEKTADPSREALTNAVEQRAWEALSQYGVVPQTEEG